MPSPDDIRLEVILLETDAKIEKKILQYTAKLVNEKIGKLVKRPDFMDKFSKVFKKWIFDSLALQELRGNTKLRADLGLSRTGAARASGAIADAVSQTLTFSYQKWDAKLTGGRLQISIQPSNFENVLNQSWAEFESEGGYRIPWLSWLLTRGDDIIITGYEVGYGRGLGRSGIGRMSGDGEDSRLTFRVNPAFSGTMDKNFITEALTSRDKIKEIRDIFISFIVR